MRKVKLQKYNKETQLLFTLYDDGYTETVKFNDTESVKLIHKSGELIFTGSSLLKYYKNSEGHEYWADYDSRNNITYYREIFIDKTKNNSILSQCNNGIEEYFLYDSDGLLISYSNTNGRTSEYDKSTRCWHDTCPYVELNKNSNPFDVKVTKNKTLETWRYYNEKGVEIKYEDNYGYRFIVKYDNGKLVRELYINDILQCQI